MLIAFGKRVPRDRSWIYRRDFKSSLKEVSRLKRGTISIATQNDNKKYTIYS